MWVWSDELMKRVDDQVPGRSAGIPLVAYAVAPETDLDAFAAEMLGSAVAERNVEGAVARPR